MITQKEVERRLLWISEMRDIITDMRKSALEAFTAGRLPYPPSYDIRTDHAYWRGLAEEKGVSSS